MSSNICRISHPTSLHFRQTRKKHVLRIRNSHRGENDEMKPNLLSRKRWYSIEDWNYSRRRNYCDPSESWRIFPESIRSSRFQIQREVHNNLPRIRFTHCAQFPDFQRFVVRGGDEQTTVTWPRDIADPELVSWYGFLEFTIVSTPYFD